jgi:hypothetical protein
MRWLTRTLRDPFADDEILRRARYGVIEVRDGQLVAVHVRRWPKVISILEVEWLGQRVHARSPGDRLLVYYNQPRRYPNFLALTYVLSQRGCTLATLRCARTVLDQVARVKRSDAILCDVWNPRISSRLLARWGWEPHKPQRWHRHYIKRFYGVYPPAGERRAARGCLAADGASSAPETALVAR